MYVLLASDSATVPAPLDADRFERLVNKVAKNRGQVLLPRFSVKQHTPLSEPLKAEGLALAFSDDADFSGISPILRIDDVSQEVRVQVDEEGTVAAAATVVKMVPKGASLYEHPFTMEVNRPFYFAIREDATKAVLFMGRVVQPE